MKYAIAMMLFLASFGVFSAPAVSTLNWTAPTTRTDGTPLAPTEIQEFRVYYGVDIGGNPLVVGPDYADFTGENAAEITLDLTPRAEPYVISFAITTVDTDGLQSELSETVTKTFDVQSTANPSAPTSLTFTVTCTDGCVITETTGE